MRGYSLQDHRKPKMVLWWDTLFRLVDNNIIHFILLNIADHRVPSSVYLSLLILASLFRIFTIYLFSPRPILLICTYHRAPNFIFVSTTFELDTFELDILSLNIKTISFISVLIFISVLKLQQLS